MKFPPKLSPNGIIWLHTSCLIVGIIGLKAELHGWMNPSPGAPTEEQSWAPPALHQPGFLRGRLRNLPAIVIQGLVEMLLRCHRLRFDRWKRSSLQRTFLSGHGIQHGSAKLFFSTDFQRLPCFIILSNSPALGHVIPHLLRGKTEINGQETI